MSEINRTSASEEARAAAEASARNKVKPGNKAAMQKGGQQAGINKKELKSTFDEMLGKMSEAEAPQILAQENSFDSRLKEIHKEEDRSSSDRDKEDDKKTSDKSESGGKTRESKEVKHEKVNAKQHSGQGQQDSGKDSDGEKGGHGRGLGGKSSFAQLTKADLKQEALRNPVQGFAMPGMQTSAVKAPEAVEATPKLPKAVLDQIIQQVRIGLNKDLKQEMEIDFNDQVFNGLRLKVTSHGKEVSVEFIVPNRSVRDCFKEERENIACALGEKGIDVRSIDVTMRG